MKPRAVHGLYLLLAVGVVVWFVGRSGGGAEAQIRGRFSEVVALVEKSPGEGALEAADKARRLGAYFEPTFVLEVPRAGSIGDRDALVRPFVGLRQPLDRLEAVTSGVDVTVDEAAGTARLAAALSLVGVGASVDLIRGSYRVTVDWRRTGRTWSIVALRVEEATGLLGAG